MEALQTAPTPIAARRQLKRDHFIVAASILVPLLLLMPLAGVVATLGLDVLFLLTALVTWLIWRFLSPKITEIVIHGLRSRSKLHLKSGTGIFLVHEQLDPQFGWIQILQRSLLPLVLVLGISSASLGLQARLTGVHTPLSLTIDTLLLALLVWPTVSVFVIPVTWVLEGVGVRFLNERKITVEAFRIFPFWFNFLGATTIVSFLYTLLSVPSPESIPSRVGEIIALVWLLYPPAIFLTAFYHIYSLPNHLRKAYLSFEKKGVKVVEWPITKQVSRF
jgi:hypothetical protein